MTRILTLARLILLRLTLARFTMNPLTFSWLTFSLTAKTVLQTQPLAQNAEAASVNAASFFRTSATTAIFVNIDCATFAYFAANIAANTHHGCSVPPVDVIYNILIASAATPDHGDPDAAVTVLIVGTSNVLEGSAALVWQTLD
jgi:hypothetical protein